MNVTNDPIPPELKGEDPKLGLLSPKTQLLNGTNPVYGHLEHLRNKGLEEVCHKGYVGDMALNGAHYNRVSYDNVVQKCNDALYGNKVLAYDMALACGMALADGRALAYGMALAYGRVLVCNDAHLCGMILIYSTVLGYSAFHAHDKVLGYIAAQACDMEQVCDSVHVCAYDSAHVHVYGMALVCDKVQAYTRGKVPCNDVPHDELVQAYHNEAFWGFHGKNIGNFAADAAHGCDGIVLVVVVVDNTALGVALEHEYDDKFSEAADWE